MAHSLHVHSPPITTEPHTTSHHTTHSPPITTQPLTISHAQVGSGEGGAEAVGGNAGVPAGVLLRHVHQHQHLGVLGAGDVAPLLW